MKKRSKKKLKPRIDRAVLLGKIMRVIKETPTISTNYICHGDLHHSNKQDYPTMRKLIEEALKQTGGE